MAGMTREHDAIDGYVSRLREALAFDAALANRAAEEIEAHLRDAAAALDQPGEGAQKRVIERFGAPETLAAGFAQELMPSRLATFWYWLAAATLGVFVAMRIRKSLTPMEHESEFIAASVGAFVDRWAFVVAVVLVSAAWIGMAVGERHAQMHRQLSLAMGALTLSTLGGMVSLAALGNPIVPSASLLAMAAEFTLLGIVAFRLLALDRQARSARRLQHS